MNSAIMTFKPTHDSVGYWLLLLPKIIFRQHDPLVECTNANVLERSEELLGVRVCDVLCEKVVLDVHNFNNFIITTPIKMVQNGKDIIRSINSRAGS